MVHVHVHSSGRPQSHSPLVSLVSAALNALTFGVSGTTQIPVLEFSSGFQPEHGQQGFSTFQLCMVTNTWQTFIAAVHPYRPFVVGYTISSSSSIVIVRQVLSSAHRALVSCYAFSTNSDTLSWGCTYAH